ncbi:IS3 family transposase [Janthinobacterium fluminis]
MLPWHAASNVLKGRFQKKCARWRIKIKLKGLSPVQYRTQPLAA